MNLEETILAFFDEARDQWALAAKRHGDIMTSNQDVQNAIAALPVAAFIAALEQLQTDVNTAISDMGTGGDTARAGFVTALTAAATGLASAVAMVNQIDTELVAAIAAATSPPATQPAVS